MLMNHIALSRLFGFLLVAAMFTVTWTVLVYQNESAAVEECRERGGSFDFERGACDLETSHPPVSFHERHGRLFWFSVVLLLASIVGVWLLFRAYRYLA